MAIVAGALVALSATARAEHVADVPGQIDVNRPRSPFQCDTPIGTNWYGSTDRCLEELCAGENVYNEYIFDTANRRRKNPCYGRSPTEYKQR